MSVALELPGARAVRSIQVIVLLLCLLINVLDGFDLQVTSFTSTRIMAEWSLAPAAMGLIFSAGLAGVGLGSFVLSPLADRFGRRPAALIGLALITLGMLAVWRVTGPRQLAVLRGVTGLGIGLLLPCLNTAAAEYAPSGWQSFAISVYATGYPIGGALCGALAPYLNLHAGWRSAYVGGGAVSLLLLLVCAWLLPESLEFLLNVQPRGALPRARRIAERLHRPPVVALPPRASAAARAGPLAPFRAGLASRALLISAAFFLLWLTEFFIVSWTPAILTREGWQAVAAARAGVMLTLGGMAGTFLVGLFGTHLDLIKVCVTYLIGGFVLALVFGFASGSGALLPICVVLGFLLFGSAVGLYAVAARIFPPQVRASGTGVAVAFGRAGAVVGLSLGGLLIGWGWSRALYVGVLIVPLLIAAAATGALRPFAIERS